jgi:prepilin peptidase CpaA
MELTEKELIQWGVVIGASLAASVMDVRTRRIPNLLTGPLFLTGLIWSAGQGGISGIAEALAAAVLMSFPFVLLFIFAGGGAGDAKLAAALGAWLSIKEAGIALACVCIAGGILGLIIAVYRKRLKNVLANLLFPVRDMIIALLCRIGYRQATQSFHAIEGEKLTVPYGIAIFVGVCVAGGIALL